MTLARTREGKPKRLDLQQRQKITGLLLIAPWLAGFILFKLLPILASLAISFTDFHMLHPEETAFVGLENYARMLDDPAAGFLLLITIGDAIRTVPLQLVASILLAVLLNNPRLKNKTLAQTLFFIPSIIPSVAILFMWLGFANPSTGWLNRLILKPLGFAEFDLYTEAAFELLFALSSLWAIGPGMLIMLGALRGMSDEVHEAARVDGAGPLERFFFITLPLISPAIFFSLIINLISVFGGVVLLDRGNVFSGSSSPFDGYISEVMFGDFQLGYAASLAWTFFILVMIVILALFTTSRRWVYYPDLEGKP
jgi:multiple sugar transport system permease protein